MKKINRIIVIMLIFVFTFVLSSCNSNKGVLVQDEEWNDMIKNGISISSDRAFWHIYYMYWNIKEENDDFLNSHSRYKFLRDNNLDLNYYICTHINETTKHLGIYIDKRIPTILEENGIRNIIPDKEYELYDNMVFYQGKIVPSEIIEQIPELKDVDLSIYSYEFEEPIIPRRIDDLVLIKLLKLVPMEAENVISKEKQKIYYVYYPIGKLTNNSFEVEVEEYKRYEFFRESLFHKYIKVDTYYPTIDCTKEYRTIEFVKQYWPYEDKEYYDEFYEFVEEYVVERRNQGNFEVLTIDFDRFIEGLIDMNK
ncbi:MAG: hypothetical protein IJS58_01295 [Bacilli bacterium]|nr:hypothetical protein [Bacilli bacterium]